MVLLPVSPPRNPAGTPAADVKFSLVGVTTASATGQVVAGIAKPLTGVTATEGLSREEKEKLFRVLQADLQKAPSPPPIQNEQPEKREGRKVAAARADIKTHYPSGVDPNKTSMTEVQSVLNKPYAEQKRKADHKEYSYETVRRALNRRK